MTMPLDDELEEPIPDVEDEELLPLIEDIDEPLLIDEDMDELLCLVLFMPDMDELLCLVVFVPDMDELLPPMPDIEDVAAEADGEYGRRPMLGPTKGNMKSHSPTTKAAPPTASLVLTVVGITSSDWVQDQFLYRPRLRLLTALKVTSLIPGHYCPVTKSRALLSYRRISVKGPVAARVSVLNT